MNRNRWLAVIGTVGLAAAATGCGEDKELRKYLAPDGPMEVWQNQLSDAVCQLEVANPSGLDPAKRICPTGPGDKKPPPSYPPR